MTHLIRVQESRRGVNRIKAITATELRELILGALVEVHKRYDLCGSIAVAGGTSTPRASEDTHRAIFHQAYNRFVIIQQACPGDELTPESAVRTLPRTTRSQEEQRSPIDLSHRRMHLQHPMGGNSHAVDNHNEAVDEEGCRGIIQQDIRHDLPPLTVNMHHMGTLTYRHLQANPPFGKLINSCTDSFRELIFEQGLGLRRG